MNFLIDIIGAFVAGTIVIITILYSMFNVRQMNYNTEVFLNLNTTANNLVEVIDSAYLEPVGVNLTQGENAVFLATPNAFGYRNRATSTSPLTEYRVEMRTQNNKNTLVVTRNNVVEYNSYPVFFENSNVFTYFDASTAPTTNAADVFGVRVDLNLVADSWSNSPDKTINYPISFWRYFRNVYIVNDPGPEVEEEWDTPIAVSSIEYRIILPLTMLGRGGNSNSSPVTIAGLNIGQTATHSVTLHYTHWASVAERQAVANKRIITTGTGLQWNSGSASVTKLSNTDAWIEFRILAEDNGGEEVHIRVNY